MSDQQHNSYKYYMLGETTPVRVTLDANGLKRGAEAIDTKTGDLVIKPTLLSRLENSDEVQEISKDDFESAHDQAKKKSARPAHRQKLQFK